MSHINRQLGAKAYQRRPQNGHRDCWDNYLSENSARWQKLAKRSIKRVERHAWKHEAKNEE